MTEGVAQPDPRNDPDPSSFYEEQAWSEVSGAIPTGTVVILVANSPHEAWAAKAAMDLSAAWAQRGRRVVLADLHLESPLLETAPESSDLEGIVDIFLYGASLSRVATPVRSGLFYLLPAGTYTPDPSEIFKHPRWRKLVAGFRDTNATLLVFAPATSPDLPRLAAWSSEAIVLGDGGRDVVDKLAAAGIGLLGVVGGPATGSEATLAVADEPSQPDTDAEMASPHVPPRQPLFGDSNLELPPPSARRRSDNRRPNILLIALVLIGAILIVGYVIASLRPDLLPEPAVDSGAAAADVNGGVGGAAREGEMLLYSVQVKAFTTLRAAREQMAVEQRRASSTPFFVSPEEIQGVDYYKILAGLATDSAEALSLFDQLVEEGSIEPAEGLDTYGMLQYGLLSFDLGEFSTREDALERADSLLALQVPSYAVAVPYSDGTRRWQLYGGAYRDSPTAERMGELIEAAGMERRLIARAGLPYTPTE